MSMKKNDIPKWISDFLNSLPYDREEEKINILRRLKKYPWVSDFFDRIHYSEKRTICLRLIKNEGIDEVFAEIDKQLSSYEINVYDEIEKKLSLKPEIDKTPDRRIGRDIVLSAIIDGAVFCNPQIPVDLKGNSSDIFQSTRQIRDDLEKAKKMQCDIMETANKLISLIDSYENIRGKGFVDSVPFHSSLDSGFDLFHLIDRASRTMIPDRRQYSYEHYIEPHIKNAEDASNCNTDYYPSLQEILNVVSLEMAVNEVVFSRSFIDWNRVLGTRQTSASDFIRFFLDSLEEHKPYQLPGDFKIKNSTIADIAACVLGITDGCTEENVRKIKKKMKAENL